MASSAGCGCRRSRTGSALEIPAAFAAAITENAGLREQLYSARTAAHAYDVLHAEESEDL